MAQKKVFDQDCRAGDWNFSPFRWLAEKKRPGEADFTGPLHITTTAM